MDTATWLHHPPSPTPSDFDVINFFFVVALVFLAVVAMFLLHTLGPLRRWLNHGLPHHIVMGVYTLSYPLVGYTIGRMQSSDWYVNDFTVWAVFLLLLLCSTDSLTACRLDDVDKWKSLCINQLFKGFLLVLIILKFGYDDVDAKYLWYPLAAILFVIVIKSYVMISSMRMVNKSYLGKNVKVIAEYMQHVDNKMVAFNPVTLEGYRYMVAGEKHCVNRRGCTPWYKYPDDLKVTTVEQICRCKGNLLTGDRGKALKDMCISMALSKMLNRRFAGFKLSEAQLEKTHDLVFKGLLAGEEERSFRVIEEELVFVHDMYYTSSISESILDQSIEEASKLLLKEAEDKKIKGGKNKKVDSRCEILMQISTETRLVEQGVHLARQLIDNIQDFTTRWKVLSDFWAEMMLYVSPSDDARAHLEVLARGGEFITHLWALLTHAGVLNRGPTGPKDVV